MPLPAEKIDEYGLLLGDPSIDVDEVSLRRILADCRRLKEAAAGNWKLLARVYTVIGLANERLERWADALDAVSAAARLDPSNWVYSSNVGLTLRNLGRFDEALAEYREAQRRAGGTNATIQSHIAAILFQQGKPDDALKALLEAGQMARSGEPLDDFRVSGAAAFMSNVDVMREHLARYVERLTARKRDESSASDILRSTPREFWERHGVAEKMKNSLPEFRTSGFDVGSLPVDDEPLSPEDIEAMNEGRADAAAGRTTSHADLLRELFDTP